MKFKKENISVKMWEPKVIKKTLFRIPKYDEKTFHKMYTFYKEGKFCDVVLVAGNDKVRVPAHRLIICAASTYFEELLDTLPSGEVELEGIDGDVLLTLMDFIYNSTLELAAVNVDHIMKGAHRLKIDAVVTECCDFVAARMCNENCLSIVVISHKEDYPELYEKGLMCASERFEEVIKDKSFFLLEIDVLCKLLRRNDIVVQSEEDVFHAMMSWVQYDKENRDQFTYRLLCLLRFPLLKPEFIASEMEQVCQSPETQGLIIKACKWHMLPASRSAVSPELCAPRNQRRQTVLLEGGIEKEGTIAAEIFDPLLGDWTVQNWPAKPKSGWYSSGLFVKEKVYLAGTTIENGSEISCVDCYQSSKNTELPSMAAHRFSFGMAELGGVLYAVGGTHGTDSLDVVEKWDPNLPESWQEVAPMCAARSQPAVAVLNGLLYVIGCNSDFEHNIFEFYDPQTNTWAELKSPGEARTSLGLTALNGHLYAVGGRTKGGVCTMVEVYDPKTDSWTEISPSGRYHEYLQCTVSLDRLIVLAEYNVVRSEHILEEYNPETGHWKTLKPLKRRRGTLILISQ